ncbi:hypothetical protein [Roseibium marinum]|uniref:hypothetical protein n=1 Tax=Roseibium marinum TaxID=281252 RepID=UPI0011AFB9C7|nr:hypothetical protein [Roseibium marinum]
MSGDFQDGWFAVPSLTVAALPERSCQRYRRDEKIIVFQTFNRWRRFSLLPCREPAKNFAGALDKVMASLYKNRAFSERIPFRTLRKARPDSSVGRAAD